MSFRQWQAKRSARKTKMADNTIFVRNIIATQPVGTAGEFRSPSKNESSDQLLGRMLNQIDSLAIIALKEHLRDNFEYPNEYKNPVRLREKANLEVPVILESEISERAKLMEPTELDIKAAELKLKQTIQKGKQIDELVVLFRAVDDLQMAGILSEPTQIDLRRAEASLRQEYANSRAISREFLISAAKYNLAYAELTKEREAKIERKVQEAGANRAEMKADKRNNLVLLTTNEFSFYPSEQQGALKLQDFEKLILALEKLGSMYPENMHLLLSSFPVEDAQGNVHNIVLYVECGHQPKIHSFAKVNPDTKDPNYPNTTTPFLTAGSIAQYLIDQIAYADIQIIKTWNNSKTLEGRELDLLLRVCMSNPDYCYKNDGTGVKELEQLKIAIAHAKSLSSNAPEDKKLQALIGVSARVKMFKAYIENQQFQIASEAQTATTVLPFATVSADVGVGVVRGGHIPITTVGGAKGELFIEICLEHLQNVAKTKLQQRLEEKKQQGERIDKAYAQIITSNSVLINKDRLIGNSFVHADTDIENLSNSNKLKRSGFDIPYGMVREEMLEKQITHSDSRFGGEVRVRIYKPQAFDSIGKQFIAHREIYNKMVDEMETLKHYRVQHPDQAAEIKKQENETMLRYSAEMGDVKGVFKALKGGADVNAVDEDGNTAFHLLLMNSANLKRENVIAVIMHLLALDASITIENKFKVTASQLVIGDEQLKDLLYKFATVEDVIKDVQLQSTPTSAAFFKPMVQQDEVTNIEKLIQYMQQIEKAYYEKSSGEDAVAQKAAKEFFGIWQKESTQDESDNLKRLKKLVSLIEHTLAAEMLRMTAKQITQDAADKWFNHQLKKYPEKYRFVIMMALSLNAIYKQYAGLLKPNDHVAKIIKMIPEQFYSHNEFGVASIETMKTPSRRPERK